MKPSLSEEPHVETSASVSLSGVLGRQQLPRAEEFLLLLESFRSDLSGQWQMKRAHGCACVSSSSLMLLDFNRLPYTLTRGLEVL